MPTRLGLAADDPICDAAHLAAAVADGNAPWILNRSFTITAEIQVPQGDSSRMTVAQGGRFGGYTAGTCTSSGTSRSKSTRRSPQRRVFVALCTAEPSLARMRQHVTPICTRF
jgi:hypothetical protein